MNIAIRILTTFYLLKYTKQYIEAMRIFMANYHLLTA